MSNRLIATIVVDEVTINRSTAPETGMQVVPEADAGLTHAPAEQHFLIPVQRWKVHQPGVQILDLNTQLFQALGQCLQLMSGVDTQRRKRGQARRAATNTAQKLSALGVRRNFGARAAQSPNGGLGRTQCAVHLRDHGLGLFQGEEAGHDYVIDAGPPAADAGPLTST